MKDLSKIGRLEAAKKTIVGCYIDLIKATTGMVEAAGSSVVDMAITSVATTEIVKEELIKIEILGIRTTGEGAIAKIVRVVATDTWDLPLVVAKAVAY